MKSSTVNELSSQVIIPINKNRATFMQSRFPTSIKLPMSSVYGLFGKLQDFYFLDSNYYKHKVRPRYRRGKPTRFFYVEGPFKGQERKL